MVSKRKAFIWCPMSWSIVQQTPEHSSGAATYLNIKYWPSPAFFCDLPREFLLSATQSTLFSGAVFLKPFSQKIGSGNV